MDTAGGRRILKVAGAQVDENTRIVGIPQNMIEHTLALAPKNFTLGARRPGWDLPLNTGECNLLLDGEGTSVLDRKSGKHRDATFHDWLDEVIDRVGPGGHFLDHPSTVSAVRGDEWYINRLGVNTSLDAWEAAGRPDIMEESREAVDRILSTHQPLVLAEEIDRELDRIRKKAADSLS